ncbi:MAG: hypothetical protein EOM28_04495 [Clostridia bacterium]|nr:hypothetical protein [Clostridia bacterium]
MKLGQCRTISDDALCTNLIASFALAQKKYNLTSGNAELCGIAFGMKKFLKTQINKDCLPNSRKSRTQERGGCLHFFGSYYSMVSSLHEI